MLYHELIISEKGRLDKLLAVQIGQSRNQIEKLIREGLVTVENTTVTKPSFALKEGDRITYRFRQATAKEPIVVDFDIEILYEDNDLLVVNKPSGLVVHPAPSVKGATLVDWLVQKGISLSTISGEERHGIVHRIDKETTGALVIAKNNRTHQVLSEQLRNKSMGRYYLALIDLPLKDNKCVEASISRNPHNRLKMVVADGGREAKTDFVRIAESDKQTALISAKLYTGRTHQIRVHLESLGRHILGDTLYGFKSRKDKIPRVYLHAYILYLVHPSTGKNLEIIAPLFEDMQLYITKNFNKGDIDEKIHPIQLKQCFAHFSATA